MKAILVRHGETEYNAQGLLQGYAPVPLSHYGRQQALRVGPRLRSLRPTVLYSSDIQRAYDTAACISQELGLPIQACPGLREWHIGTWVNRMASDFYAHLEALGAHPATYVPEGGESHIQAQARVVAQMQDWATRHAHDTVLGVSHGMAIDLFVRYILGLDVRQTPPYRIVNTSVNIFQYQHGRWEIITLNDIGHLETFD
ncbi:MAG: histidine phosphatase family protein [Candidatus Tectimicrobiota bacterium]